MFQKRPSLSIRLALVLSTAAGVTQVEAKRLDGIFTSLQATEVLVMDYGSGTYDVRILGIDAPEPGQPFAEEARAFVRDLAVGREGYLRFRARNAAGEMVSRVYVGGHDIALELLRAGLAWRLPSATYKPRAEGLADDLTAAEAEGRAAKRGIWSQPGAISPWEFRGVPAAAVASEPFGELTGLGGATDRNTSQRSGADHECAVAKDPTNPQQLFVLCNVQGASGLFAARSTDGGATWSYPDPADKTIADGDAGQGTSACCDPSLAWDSFGNLFVSYLGNSIDTLLSTNGGVTFTQLPQIGSGGVDQQTIVTADLSDGSHVVWVVWNQGSMVAAGATVTGLGAVSAWSTAQSAGTSGCSFGDIAVAPNGAVVQVCGTSSGQGPNAQLRVNTDTDGLGPNGFGAAVIATTTNVGGFDFIPAQDSRSVDAESGLAYDRNPDSPHFGRLYLMYTDELINESDDLNIHLRFSDDDGATWSAPVQVNDDATTRSQFNPKLASDPETGNVAVCWHDARNSALNTAMQIYCSSKSETALLFQPNQLVSDGSSTSNGSGVEFGDYAGITLIDSIAHPVWADTSNSTGNNPNGTSNFDAYVDFFVVPLFADGFESDGTGAWDLVGSEAPAN